MKVGVFLAICDTCHISTLKKKRSDYKFLIKMSEIIVQDAATLVAFNHEIQYFKSSLVIPYLLS